MPKNKQHAVWLDLYYNRLPNDPTQPGNPKIRLVETTRQIAADCNAFNGTLQGVDGVDSQIVGRHLSECRQKAADQPRAVRMTTATNEVLEGSYQISHYPSPGDRMIIMHKTGLTYKQVKNWFEQKAKNLRKRGGTAPIRRPSNKHATQMWKKHNKDQDGYVQKLLDGSINPVTGEIVTVPMGSRLPNPFAQLPNAFVQDTSNNSNPPGVQLNIAPTSMGYGTSVGVGLQTARNFGQDLFQPWQMDALGHMTRPDRSTWQDTQERIQISNMPQTPVMNLGPNSFETGPNYTADDGQQAGQQAGCPRGQNPYPAFWSHNGQPSHNHLNSNNYINHQSNDPGDQSAPQSYQTTGEPLYQWRGSAAVYPLAQKIQTEQPLNESWEQRKFAAPSKKRKPCDTEDEMGGNQRSGKRSRPLAPALPPCDCRMNNIPGSGMPPQVASQILFAAPSGKRKLASVEHEIDNNEHSKKRPRADRQMKSLQTLEFEENNGLNFEEVAEQHTPEVIEEHMAHNDSYSWSPLQPVLPPQSVPSLPAQGSGDDRGYEGDTSQGSTMSSTLLDSTIDPQLIEFIAFDFQGTANPKKLIPETKSNGKGVNSSYSAQNKQEAEPTKETDSILEAQPRQGKDSTAVLIKYPSPEIHGMHNEGGEFKLGTVEHAIESPAQEPSPPEDPAFPQPAAPSPEQTVEGFVASQGFGDLDMYLLQYSIDNYGIPNDFSYEAFC